MTGASSHVLRPPLLAGDDAVLRSVADARERDPLGHRVHVALALTYLFTLPFATAPNAISFALLLGYALLRLPSTWRCHRPLGRMPILLALAGWVAWTALSIAWSSNPSQGADEIGAARVILLPLMLWPILDRVPLLIAAALAGVFAQNLVQGCQWLEILGLHPGEEGRLNGIIHQTGEWCAAAVCWHLGATLTTRGRVRWISLAALAAAAAGLVASGSRGPWFATALAAPACLLVVAVRRPAARRSALILLGVSALALVAAWPLARRMIVPRVERAVHEVAAARESGDYTTSVGLRLGLWTWAWRIYLGAPVVGTGAGSYQDELFDLPVYVALLERHRDDELVTNWLTRDHAHSTYLHTLATTGSVGGILLLLVVALAVHRAARDRPDHPWVDGTLFALVGWLIGAQFDCYHLNGHLFGLFAVFVAVTLAPRLPTDGRLVQ